MSYIPHTNSEIEKMLEEIGVSNIESLFSEIPDDIKINNIPNIANGMSELEVVKHIKNVTSKDSIDLNFIGAGAYQHYIPSAVWEIASRGEFYSSYTPYQAEVSQGNLQVIFEYQSMIASLCGMDVSNASMYDGATALAESILMSIRCNKKHNSRKILIADILHPNYIGVIKSITCHQNIEIVEITFNKYLGKSSSNDLSQFNHDDFAAVVIPQPNFIGQITSVDEITDWAHSKGALVIGVVNPMALALIKSPREWGSLGADIVCGDGQPLGIPLSSGGPYFGFITSRNKYLRNLPGRIVGKTEDLDGKEAYTLTLQAREQHIRRSKATSNICTNQGLMVTAATIYMSLMGPNGLKNIITKSHQNTIILMRLLTQIDGVKCHYSENFLYEIVVELPVASDYVINRFSQLGIQAGFNLNNINSFGRNMILICVTEAIDMSEINYYIDTLKIVLNTRNLVSEENINYEVCQGE